MNMQNLHQTDFWDSFHFSLASYANGVIGEDVKNSNILMMLLINLFSQRLSLFEM